MTLIQFTVFFFEKGDKYPLHLLEDMEVFKGYIEDFYDIQIQENEQEEGKIIIAKEHVGVFEEDCIAVITNGTMCPNFFQSKFHGSYEDFGMQSGVEWEMQEMPDECEYMVEYATEQAIIERERFLKDIKGPTSAVGDFFHDIEIKFTEGKTVKVLNLVTAWEYKSYKDSYSGEYETEVSPLGVVDFGNIKFK